MALDHEEWASIDKRVNELIHYALGGPGLVQGKVVKADKANNLVWLREFGDQPIPLFAFELKVKYYDTQPVGNVVSGSPVNTQLAVKNAVVTPVCPNVGDTVLVARQFGSRRLPKCLGVLQSTNFIIPEDE